MRGSGDSAVTSNAASDKVEKVGRKLQRAKMGVLGRQETSQVDGGGKRYT
jgi:hypothetical protein